MFSPFLDGSYSPPPYFNEFNCLAGLDELIVHQDEEYELGFKREYTVKTASKQTIFTVQEINDDGACKKGGTYTISVPNSDTPFLTMKRTLNCCCLGFCLLIKSYMQITHHGNPIGRVEQMAICPCPGSFDIYTATGARMKIKQVYTFSVLRVECKVILVHLNFMKIQKKNVTLI